LIPFALNKVLSWAAGRIHSHE